jgi:hypothetical protein
MSRTQRNIPEGKKLSDKEEKFAKRNKLKHGVHTKMNPNELEFSQSAKREAKKLKHHKQRHDAAEEIVEQIEDEE